MICSGYLRGDTRKENQYINEQVAGNTGTRSGEVERSENAINQYLRRINTSGYETSSRST